MPVELIDVSDVDPVDRVIEYQSPSADVSVLMKDGYGTQNFRVYYLKQLREDWEWVDNSEKGKPFVLLKRR